MPSSVEIQLQLAHAVSPTVSPAPHQVIVWAKLASGDQTSLSQLACAKGLDGFPHGDLPIKQIVVCVGPTGPTLDDLLAASLLANLCEHGSLPAGAEPFARFSAMVREGFTPAVEPVEAALDAVFLALTAPFEDSLEDAEARAALVREWLRMEVVIFTAMQSERDPFKEALFTESAGFAREIAFLREDQRVYARDMQSGKKLELKLEDGSPLPGLLLNAPKSLLFKRWARHDKAAPGGIGYALLAVNWPDETWVISTDPVLRVSLKSLAEQLDAAEAKETGAADPKKGEAWFDGAPFHHTLIASPGSGTKLSKEQVLEILLAWGHGEVLAGAVEEDAGKKPHFDDSRLFRSVVAAVILSGVLLVAWLLGRRETPESTDLDYCHAMSVQTRNIDTSSNAGVFIGINNYGGDFRNLTYAVDDAVALAHLFVIELKLVGPENAWLSIDGEPATRFTQRQLDELRKQGVRVSDGHYTTLRANLAVASRIAKTSENLLLVSISTHGFDDGKSAYIVPADGKRQDILGTCLSVASINELLDQSAARKRILFVDACRDAPLQGSKASSTPYTENFFDAFKRAQGQAWFASCGPGQLSNEYPTAGHGIFTYYLLHALKGSAAPDPRGFITLGTVQQFVSARVTDWSKRFNPQTPFYHPNEGASEIPFAVPDSK